jgi:hypothetical protein
MYKLFELRIAGKRTDKSNLPNVRLRLESFARIGIISVRRAAEAFVTGAEFK